MTQRRLLRAAAAGALLLAAACRKQAPQRAEAVTATAASPAAAGAGTAQVTAFASIPWGTPPAQVESAFGSPQRVDTLPDGVVALTYPRHLQREDASMFLVFRPGEGLVQGDYAVEVLAMDRCRAVLAKLRQAITARYPTLAPRDHRRFPDMPPPCAPDPARRGSAKVRWDDPANGAAIMLGSQDTMQVVVTYITRRALEQAKKDVSADLARDF